MIEYVCILWFIKAHFRKWIAFFAVPKAKIFISHFRFLRSTTSTIFHGAIYQWNSLFLFFKNMNTRRMDGLADSGRTGRNISVEVFTSYWPCFYLFSIECALHLVCLHLNSINFCNIWKSRQSRLDWNLIIQCIMMGRIKLVFVAFQSLGMVKMINMSRSHLFLFSKISRSLW